MENEVKNAEQIGKEAPKMREIIIQTDGQKVFVKKAEASMIELSAILSMILNQINQPPQEEPKKEEPAAETK